MPKVNGPGGEMRKNNFQIICFNGIENLKISAMNLSRRVMKTRPVCKNLCFNLIYNYSAVLFMLL